jgi:hypothetical protein
MTCAVTKERMPKKTYSRQANPTLAWMKMLFEMQKLDVQTETCKRHIMSVIMAKWRELMAVRPAGQLILL